MAFIFFLLVNATLFVRPMEIVPELEGVKLYEYFILASLIFAIPEILHYFGSYSLEKQPITLFVCGLFVTTLFSKAGESAEMLRHGEYFLKILVYYVLAVTLINSGTRLRIFLTWLLICLLVLTSLTVLQYHDVIQLPGNTRKLADPDKNFETGELTAVYRLQ